MQTHQFKIGDLVTLREVCCHRYDIFRRYVSTHPGRITHVDGDLMNRISVEFEMVHIREASMWIPLLYRVQAECLVPWLGVQP